MTVAVVQFPGSNCDQDALFALQALGLSAEYVWQSTTDLSGFGAVFVPGGFSYGDYLRCGAMASRSAVMQAVKEVAQRGVPVIGACNGFQILCEAGLLPGALLQNERPKFVCRDVCLRAETRRSAWTAAVDRVIRIPIAHGEGRYVIEPDELKALEDAEQIAFRYVNASGDLSSDSNPNGSVSSIAGVLNREGNVLGLMPHPERAINPNLGGTDGRLILAALTAVNA